MNRIGKLEDLVTAINFNFVRKQIFYWTNYQIDGGYPIWQKQALTSTENILYYLRLSEQFSLR